MSATRYSVLQRQGSAGAAWPDRSLPLFETTLHAKENAKLIGDDVARRSAWRNGAAGK